MVSFLNVLYFFPDWLCHFTEKYFLVVLFIMLYKVIIVIFETVDGILKWTTKMKRRKRFSLSVLLVFQSFAKQNFALFRPRSFKGWTALSTG